MGIKEAKGEEMEGIEGDHTSYLNEQVSLRGDTITMYNAGTTAGIGGFVAPKHCRLVELLLNIQDDGVAGFKCQFCIFVEGVAPGGHP